MFVFLELFQLFEVFSSVLQGSVLQVMLCSLFINDLSHVINYSRYLLVADCITVYCGQQLS
jgi:hypothetical protein